MELVSPKPICECKQVFIFAFEMYEVKCNYVKIHHDLTINIILCAFMNRRNESYS